MPKILNSVMTKSRYVMNCLQLFAEMYKKLSALIRLAQTFLYEGLQHISITLQFKEIQFHFDNNVYS